MTRHATVLVCLLTLLALTGIAQAAVGAHCVTDGEITQCVWSMVQQVEPMVVDVGDPKAQPVPMCLDCEPLAIEMVCTMTIVKGEAPVTRCVEGAEVEQYVQ